MGRNSASGRVAGVRARTVFHLGSTALCVAGSLLVAAPAAHSTECQNVGATEQPTAVPAEDGGEVTNTSCGTRSGSPNAGNTENSSFGHSAGGAVSGDGNTGVGFTGGRAVTGNRNTAVGNSSGNNVVGSNNSALGAFAGREVQGSFNTGVGDNAGRNVTGSENVALGRNAGRGIGSALVSNRATSIGSGATGSADDATALGSNSTASAASSTAVGTGATASHANSTAVGAGSATTAANQVMVGTSGTQTYVLRGMSNSATGNESTIVTYDPVTGTLTNDGGVVVGRITANRASIDTNTAGVTTNRTSIQSNTTQITTNTAAISAVEADVATNTQDILDLQSAINTNTSAMQAEIDRNASDIAENAEGIAMALSMGGLQMDRDQNFAVSANWGTFKGANAFSVAGAARLNRNVTVSGGVGFGANSGAVGGRVGLNVGW